MCNTMKARQDFWDCGQEHQPTLLALERSEHTICTQKYARIFVRRHNLLRDANSFPKATPEENCELRETGNVRGKTYPASIFSRQTEAIVYCLFL